MTQEQKPAPKPRSAHSLNRTEMRASLLAPIIIILVIWGLGMLVYLLTPGDFDTAVGLAVSASLFLFLIYWTRDATPRIRIVALLLAIPALIGIALGMVNGSAGLIVGGVGLTVLLLAFIRAITVPISYRFALRSFQMGDTERALELVDKAIHSRPDFWESHQLKAMIFLSEMDFPRAERSAKEALRQNPNAHPVYNALGQIYLAQGRFTEARTAYIDALEQDAHNAAYWLHVGISQYRLAEYRDAAESFTAAIKNTLRFPEYELQAHYYLWRCLLQLNMEEKADEIRAKLPQFELGLPILQQRVADESFPQAAVEQTDVDDMARQLELAMAAQASSPEQNQ